MILKASQRAGATQLALHLLNANDNEHVEVHELRGFIAGDLKSALHESYATSRATRCKQFMFSLSLNPPEDADVPVADFESAIEKIEQKLGLNGQPRAVVFHEKEGRRHAHCVWSRIHNDNGKLKAVHLPHFKQKLNDVARDLYMQHGWDMPAGFKNKQNRDPRNYTLAEWQQAKRRDKDPKAIKAALQQCWSQSDSKQAFNHALNDAGYMLARGDKRGFVAVDWFGEVYSLGRMTGVKSKTLKERLGKPENCASVATTKAMMSRELKALYHQYAGELKTIHKQEQKPLVQQKRILVETHQQARQSFTVKIKQRFDRENQQRQSRFRRGLLRFWDAMTGRNKKTREQNEREFKACQKRDETEKQQLIETQLKQRRKLQKKIVKVRTAQRQDMAQLQAGFIQVLSGHQDIDTLTATFSRAAIERELNHNHHSNDNAPRIER